jgi:hypothetical protein
VQYFAETLAFCLSEKNLKNFAEEVMQQIYSEFYHDQIRKVFESELVASLKLYNKFLEWHTDFL